MDRWGEHESFAGVGQVFQHGELVVADVRYTVSITRRSTSDRHASLPLGSTLR